MPVVSVQGMFWPPAVILPSVMHRFRNREDGTREILHYYLPAQSCIMHRTLASVTKCIFCQSVEFFITQTSQLRKKYKYLIVTMDALRVHLLYRAL